MRALLRYNLRLCWNSPGSEALAYPLAPWLTFHPSHVPLLVSSKRILSRAPFADTLEQESRHLYKMLAIIATESLVLDNLYYSQVENNPTTHSANQA